MIKYYKIKKENIVGHSERSKVKAGPADSCHGANISIEVRVPFDNERLEYYLIVNIDEVNHILMIQEDIRTFAIVAFHAEIHGM